MLFTAIIGGVATLVDPIAGLFKKPAPQVVPVIVPESQNGKNTKLIVGVSIGLFVLIIALYFIVKAKTKK